MPTITEYDIKLNQIPSQLNCLVGLCLFYTYKIVNKHKKATRKTKVLICKEMLRKKWLPPITPIFYCFHLCACVFSLVSCLDEGVYNTYVIDTDYREWALVMHCAEKPKSNRYLSALMLSRTPTVGINVINFLRFANFKFLST